MSTQTRTWTEHCNEKGEPFRWDLAINGVPVPGGFVVKSNEGFEIHYPHMDAKTIDTLDEAKRRLELAPPISKTGLKIDREADEGSELITTEEAGSILGISRFRINAMVSSGILPGKRQGGQTLVDRDAVLRKASMEAEPGPQGKFANLFLFYEPEGEGIQYFCEVDADDQQLVEDAKEFVRDIMSDESDRVEVRDYLSTQNFTRNRSNDTSFEKTTLAGIVLQRSLRLQERCAKDEDAEAEAIGDKKDRLLASESELSA